jgi:hypothetical protein
MAIYLRSVSDFGEHFFEETDGRIIIDLSDATSRDDVALKIGRVLRGSSSQILTRGNLDDMHDVVIDWIVDNAKKKMDVLLLHCDKIVEIEHNLLTKLALNISSSFMIGIVAAKEETDEFNMYAGISNINIYFVLNDK